MYNPMTLAQLQALAPIIPWVTYINNILTEKILQVGERGRIRGGGGGGGGCGRGLCIVK